MIKDMRVIMTDVKATERESLFIGLHVSDVPNMTWYKLSGMPKGPAVTQWGNKSRMIRGVGPTYSSVELSFVLLGSFE